MKRRTFIKRTGGALLAFACGCSGSDTPGDTDGSPPGDDGIAPINDGTPPTEDSSTPTNGDSEELWQLEEGHWESEYPLHVIYPRPDSETGEFARHRHAYPGRMYEIYIGVQFGAWPYRFEKISGPDWLNIVDETLVKDGERFVVPEGYGVLRGTAPSTPGPAEPVTIRVYDQEHGRPDPSFVDVTFSVEVSPDNFVFVDNENGDDTTGNGTISAPYRTIQAMRGSSLHGGAICIVLGDHYYMDWPTHSTEERFDTLDSENPRAYIRDVPGYCVVEGKDSRRFANERGEDSFYAGFSIENIQQDVREQDNVKVFQNWSVRAVRTTIQRTRIYNMWPGHAVNDNPGAIVCLVPSNFNLDDPESLHRYNYYVDIVVDRLWNEGDTAAGNPPAAYVSGGLRNLVERMTVKNAGYGGHIFNKWGTRYHEVRACTLVENNPSNAHVQVGASTQYGVTKHAVACWNRVGPGKIWFSGVADDPELEGFVALRNSAQGVESHTSVRNPVLRGNIAAEYHRNDHWDEDGRNIMVSSIDDAFDEDMNLVDEWKEANPGVFGKFGADIA